MKLTLGEIRVLRESLKCLNGDGYVSIEKLQKRLMLKNSRSLSGWIGSLTRKGFFREIGGGEFFRDFAIEDLAFTYLGIDRPKGCAE
jgi:hypothetical protein